VGADQREAIEDAGSEIAGQLALADFIARGELEHHLRRMRLRYQERDKGLAKIQGYNAQAAVSCEGQIILAAEISTRSPDFGNLAPTFDAAIRELQLVGENEHPGTVLADTGYWHGEQADEIAAGGTQVLIPPQSSTRETPRPGWRNGRFDFMRAVLASDAGAELYRQRARSIEPTFGQIKHNRRFRQFRRRGRAAARAEWRLITATHNLRG
jgi:hypothetical protein